MPDPAPGYQRFFAELKRRHVFRVMAVYGAVAFVILQVADLALPRLGLPEWTVTFVLVLTIVGFPIAVVLVWAFEQTPDGIRRTERAGPQEIAAIVAQPASRRWPAGLLALVGVAALVTGAWWVGRQTAPRAEAVGDAGLADVRLAMTEAGDEAGPSIAVLPFADMSPEGDQEYFSDGMTEELINTLAKIRGLTVMARTSAFAFKGANLDLRVVGDSLSVRYLVEGSVRKAGNQLRITAQLIDARDGAHLWSDTYDRRLENVFEIQREIAEAVAGELRIPLGLQDNERLVLPTEDLAAYDLYLAGRARMRDRGESVREAVQLFEAAIARDSGWAPAWAGLAESRALIPFYPMAWQDSTLWAQSLSGAESAAKRALALDVDNASALVALGNVHRDRWDWDDAEDAYQRALRIDPENVEGLQQYAELLMYVGRLDEAYRIARQALELDPSPVRMNAMALIAWLAGRPAESIRTFEVALASQEDPLMAEKLNSNLLRVYLMTGSWSDFRRLLIEQFEADDPAVAERVRSGWTVAADPPPAEVVEVLDQEWPDGTTGIMVMIGRSDGVLDRLEAQHSGMAPFGPSIGLWSPGYDPLRDDPRFQAILARRGLEGLEPRRLEPGERP